MSRHTKEGMEPAQIWPPKERTAGKPKKAPQKGFKGGTDKLAEVRGAGAGCGEERLPLRLGGPWERSSNRRWGGEKGVCASHRVGETPFQQLCSPWAVAAKGCGEGVWHKRHFWFPFKAENHGETSMRLPLPKGCCCSQSSWADFLLLPAGWAVVFWRNGIATGSWTGWL